MFNWFKSDETRIDSLEKNVRQIWDDLDIKQQAIQQIYDQIQLTKTEILRAREETLAAKEMAEQAQTDAQSVLSLAQTAETNAKTAYNNTITLVNELKKSFEGLSSAITNAYTQIKTDYGKLKASTDTMSTRFDYIRGNFVKFYEGASNASYGFYHSTLHLGYCASNVDSAFENIKNLKWVSAYNNGVAAAGNLRSVKAYMGTARTGMSQLRDQSSNLKTNFTNLSGDMNAFGSNVVTTFDHLKQNFERMKKSVSDW